MLKSYDGKLRCPKCGYEKELDSTDKSHLQKVNPIQEKDIVIIEGEKAEEFVEGELVRIECPKCGNKEARGTLEQTRSADEAPTEFYKCTKCGHKWRKYD